MNVRDSWTVGQLVSGQPVSGQPVFVVISFKRHAFEDWIQVMSSGAYMSVLEGQSLRLKR